MSELDSEFLDYLAESGCTDGKRLPPMHSLAPELGISVSKLREQLEVARAFGFVEVKPKTGIQTRSYSFLPGLRTSLLFALALDRGYFDQFGQLRQQVEATFWDEAVRKLKATDKEKLQELIEKAWWQLRGSPIQIPHNAHRDLHLTIFSRLNNPFVRAIIEAYWDAYEVVGLNLYNDYSYLEEVWTYHEKMVESILKEDYASGYQALVDHFEILQRSPLLARSEIGSSPAGQERSPDVASRIRKE